MAAMIWFRFAKDGRDIPVYYRKAYKKARHKRKSERLARGYWDTFVKRSGPWSMAWEELDDEQKKNCYESYVQDIIYENGDNAKVMEFDTWCEESRKIGEPLC